MSGRSSSKLRRFTVRDCPAILEITQTVGLTKAVGDGVLSFEHELVRCHPVDDGLEVNRLEGSILVGLVRTEFAANHQVTEDLLELPVLRALVLLALPHQEGKSRPSRVLLGNIRSSAVLCATVEIETKSTMAPRADVLRQNALPQPIQQ